MKPSELHDITTLLTLQLPNLHLAYRAKQNDIPITTTNLLGSIGSCPSPTSIPGRVAATAESGYPVSVLANKDWLLRSASAEDYSFVLMHPTSTRQQHTMTFVSDLLRTRANVVLIWDAVLLSVFAQMRSWENCPAFCLAVSPKSLEGAAYACLSPFYFIRSCSVRHGAWYPASIFAAQRHLSVEGQP